MRPGPVSTTLLAFNLPVSSATATVNGLSVEPGSNRSVITRLRSCAPVSFARLFGLYEGMFASASTSPLRTSTTITAPAFAR